jgi:hypothetical protein
MGMDVRIRSVALLAAGLLSLSSCASKRPDLELEPEPRAISRRLNMLAARHPRVALDPAGDTLYVLAVAGADPASRLVLLTSGDGGDTFEQPVPVNEPGTNVGSHGENSPILLFGPGEKIDAIWEQDEGVSTIISKRRNLDFGPASNIICAGGAIIRPIICTFRR